MLGAWLGWKRGDTVASVLARHRGVGPGFDVLRIALAALIFYSHARYIARGAVTNSAQALHTLVAPTHDNAGAMLVQEGGWSGWHRPFVVCLVPMFFALSGFLVTGSALRLRRTSTFLAFRGLRIFPALATEVALSALVLGPALTAYSLSAYFSDPAFASYFGNIIGLITFKLPGLFLSNPASGPVNLNLWTLPGEFYCYLTMAVCMALGLVYKRWLYTGALIALTVVLAPLNLLSSFDVVNGAVPTHTIAYYFLVGVAAYHWRERIPVNPALIAGAALISFLLLLSKHTVYIAPPFLTYLTIAIGMIRFPKFRVLASGDYSYGIYLYGFPICQAVMVLIPSLRNQVWALIAIGGTTTCLFAAFSWHLIEKRVLPLKRQLPKRYFPDAKRDTVPQQPAAR